MFSPIYLKDYFLSFEFLVPLSGSMLQFKSEGVETLGKNGVEEGEIEKGGKQ